MRKRLCHSDPHGDVTSLPKCHPGIDLPVVEVITATVASLLGKGEGGGDSLLEITLGRMR